MAYRCVATSVAGFVQQLAVGYIANGYHFYVCGRIPAGKDPARTDGKIVEQYVLDLSRWSRARQKKAGKANVQYLRYGHFYVIIATHGDHPFFAAEGKQIRDVRKRPIHFMGYSIGCRRAHGGGGWHASARIEQERFGELKARFARMAVHRSVEELCREFRAIPYEPYAPVRDQVRVLLRAVNRRRKAASLDFVPRESLRRWRLPVKPFVIGADE